MSIGSYPMPPGGAGDKIPYPGLIYVQLASPVWRNGAVR